jgi:hypothetical protein
MGNDRYRIVVDEADWKALQERNRKLREQRTGPQGALESGEATTTT